jgi:hypothetical protein
LPTKTQKEKEKEVLGWVDIITSCIM